MDAPETMVSAAGSAPGSAPAAAPNRAVRWKRWLPLGIALFVAFLAALVFLGPVLAAPYVRGMVERRMEEQLNAEASLAGLSFTLGGSLSLSEFSLTDLEGQPVLSVDSLEAHVNLLRALRGTYEAELTLDGLELHVRRDRDGELNLMKLPKQRRPSGRVPDAPAPAPVPGGEPAETPRGEEPAPLLDLGGRLLVRNSRIVFHDEAQGTAEIRKLELDVRLDRFNEPAPFRLALEAVGPGGPAGTVALDGSVTLAQDGRLGADSVRAAVQYAIEGLDLGRLKPAGAALASVERLEGQVSGVGAWRVGQDFQLEGAGGLELHDLDLALPGLELAGDLDLDVSDERAVADGELRANGGTLLLEGQMDLSASAAEPASSFRLALEDARADLRVQPLLAALHPAFHSLDAARGGALGGLLSLSADMRYDGPVTRELFTGGQAPPWERLSGSLRLDLAQAVVEGSPFLQDLFAQLDLGSATRSLSLEPIQLSLRGGRIHYATPWGWKLAGVSTQFSGSVGVGGDLDLRWDVPLTGALLQRAGGLAALEGQVVSVPITGTMTDPRMDFRAALREFLSTAAGQQVQDRLSEELGERLGKKIGDVPGLGDAIEEGLGGIFGGGSRKQEPAPGGNTPPTPREPTAVELLRRAEALYDEGKKKEAAAVYGELREKFGNSAVYMSRRKIIDARIEEGG